MILHKLLGSQLQRTETERNSHIEALSRDVNLFDHLYSCLTILDAKSQAMLGFNSIILAVFAIFMTQDLMPPQSVVANIGMLVVLCSALLLLSVVTCALVDHSRLGGCKGARREVTGSPQLSNEALQTGVGAIISVTDRFGLTLNPSVSKCAKLFIYTISPNTKDKHT